MSEVSSPLLAFLKYWAQTASDYDVLFAKTISARWAKAHRPVLSRRGHNPDRYTKYKRLVSKKVFEDVPITAPPGGDDHILITKFNLGESCGLAVQCPLQCSWKVNSTTHATTTRLECSKCGARATIPQFKTDQSTVLGRASLVAVRFPQAAMFVTWEAPKPADSSQGSGPKTASTEDPPVGRPSVEAASLLSGDSPAADGVASEESATRPTRRRSTRRKKPTPKAAAQESASSSSSLPPAGTSTGKRKASSLLHSPSPMDTRSISLPTIRIPPYQERLSLPRKSSSPALSLRSTASSSASGPSMATVTPPPPSPADQSDTRERSRPIPGASLIRKRQRF